MDGYREKIPRIDWFVCSSITPFPAHLNLLFFRPRSPKFWHASTTKSSPPGFAPRSPLYPYYCFITRESIPTWIPDWWWCGRRAAVLRGAGDGARAYCLNAKRRCHAPGDGLNRKSTKRSRLQIVRGVATGHSACACRSLHCFEMG